MEKEEFISLTLVKPENGKYHVRAEDITASIREDTRMVCVMMANNETGAIQPVHEIGKSIRHINSLRAKGYVSYHFRRKLVAKIF